MNYTFEPRDRGLCRAFCYHRGEGAMPDSASLRTILKSQYHAALAMLRDTIERCPDDLWLRADTPNAFWQLAYHTLFFAHLYLLDGPDAYTGWRGHQHQVQQPDGIGGPPDPKSDLPVSPRPYTTSEALEYWAICDGLVDARVDAMDLDSAHSGFYWYEVSKLEHQLVNLRHIQHHTAQLADRLRNTLGLGTRWVGSRPSS
jgi:hypothetical protein